MAAEAGLPASEPCAMAQPRWQPNGGLRPLTERLRSTQNVRVGQHVEATGSASDNTLERMRSAGAGGGGESHMTSLLRPQSPRSDADRPEGIVASINPEQPRRQLALERRRTRLVRLVQLACPLHRPPPELLPHICAPHAQDRSLNCRRCVHPRPAASSGTFSIDALSAATALHGRADSNSFSISTDMPPSSAVRRQTVTAAHVGAEADVRLRQGILPDCFFFLSSGRGPNPYYQSSSLMQG